MSLWSDVFSSFFHLGLYGALFRRNKEAAFSNYRLWESLGFVIAYAYSTMICARMKLYIVMTVLAFGTVCYILVEIRQLRKVRLLRLIFDFINVHVISQERKQKELEKKLEEPHNQMPIEPKRRVDDETDDEKDELEEDIVVTHL
jgi:hypothetical protein